MQDCKYRLPEPPMPWSVAPKDRKPGDKPAADLVWWSGEEPLPAIGERVEINFNGFGAGTVEAYFTEHGYLGVYVKLEKPPAWWVQQTEYDDGAIWKRPAQIRGCAMVYGAELKKREKGGE